MQYSTNYKMIKPAQDDFYDVDEFNYNVDIIDEELKKVAVNLRSRVKITLKANDWAACVNADDPSKSEEYYECYCQDVSVPGMTADKMPFVEEDTFDPPLKAAQIKSYRKMTSKIFKIVTGKDTVRVYVHTTPPLEDFSIYLRGDI